MPWRALPGSVDLTLRWTAWSYLPTLAPFDFELTAAALRRRPRNRIDRLDGESVRQLARLPVGGGRDHEDIAALEVRAPDDGRPGVEWRIGQANLVADSAVEGAAAIVRRRYGLDVSASALDATARSDPRLWAALAPVWPRLAGLRPPRTTSVWDALVIAICCQQLSLDVGLEQAARLAELAGAVRSVGDGPALLALPTPDALAGLREPELRALGLSRAKSAALRGMAELVRSRGLDPLALERLPTAVVRERLLAIPGIGPWTADNVLLRGFGRLEVFPGGDAGIARAVERTLGPDLTRTGGGARSFASLAAAAAGWAPARGWVYFAVGLVAGELATIRAGATVPQRATD